MKTDERRSYEEPCNYSILCKEDKEQLDRIEKLLSELIKKLADNSEEG